MRDSLKQLMEETDDITKIRALKVTYLEMARGIGLNVEHIGTAAAILLASIIALHAKDDEAFERLVKSTVEDVEKLCRTFRVEGDSDSDVLEKAAESMKKALH